MVVESKNIEGNDNGTPLLLMSLLLLLAGIVAFYYFSEIRLFYRVLGLFVVLGLAGYIVYQTSFGKTVYTYVLESKIELKKVVMANKARNYSDSDRRDCDCCHYWHTFMAVRYVIGMVNRDVIWSQIKWK